MAILPAHIVSRIPEQSWLPFGRHELPATLTSEMEFAAQALSICNDELRRLVGFYELIIALKKIDAGRKGTSDPVLNSISNIYVSLLRNTIIILPALFDRDARSVNLLRIVNTMLDVRSRQYLYAFHRLFPGGRAELDALMLKLRTIRKLLRAKHFQSSLDRITVSRNKLVSHYDVDTGASYAERSLREFEYVFLLTAKAAVLCTSILTIRQYSISWTKKAAAEQAAAFVGALKLTTPVDP